MKRLLLLVTFAAVAVAVACTTTSQVDPSDVHAQEMVDRLEQQLGDSVSLTLRESDLMEGPKILLRYMAEKPREDMLAYWCSDVLPRIQDWNTTDPAITIVLLDAAGDRVADLSTVCR